MADENDTNDNAGSKDRLTSPGIRTKPRTPGQPVPAEEPPTRSRQTRSETTPPGLPGFGRRRAITERDLTPQAPYEDQPDLMSPTEMPARRPGDPEQRQEMPALRHGMSVVPGTELAPEDTQAGSQELVIDLGRLVTPDEPLERRTGTVGLDSTSLREALEDERERRTGRRATTLPDPQTESLPRFGIHRADTEPEEPARQVEAPTKTPADPAVGDLAHQDTEHHYPIEDHLQTDHNARSSHVSIPTQAAVSQEGEVGASITDTTDGPATPPTDLAAVSIPSEAKVTPVDSQKVIGLEPTAAARPAYESKPEVPVVGTEGEEDLGLLATAEAAAYEPGQVRLLHVIEETMTHIPKLDLTRTEVDTELPPMQGDPEEHIQERLRERALGHVRSVLVNLTGAVDKIEHKDWDPQQMETVFGQALRRFDDGVYNIARTALGKVAALVGKTGGEVPDQIVDALDVLDPESSVFQSSGEVPKVEPTLAAMAVVEERARGGTEVEFPIYEGEAPADLERQQIRTVTLTTEEAEALGRPLEPLPEIAQKVRTDRGQSYFMYRFGGLQVFVDPATGNVLHASEIDAESLIGEETWRPIPDEKARILREYAAQHRASKAPVAPPTDEIYDEVRLSDPELETVEVTAAVLATDKARPTQQVAGVPPPLSEGAELTIREQADTHAHRGLDLLVELEDLTDDPDKLIRKAPQARKAFEKARAIAPDTYETTAETRLGELDDLVTEATTVVLKRTADAKRSHDAGLLTRGYETLSELSPRHAEVLSPSLASMGYLAAGWQLLDTASELQETDPDQAVREACAALKDFNEISEISPELYTSIAADRSAAQDILRTGVATVRQRTQDALKAHDPDLVRKGYETLSTVSPQYKEILSSPLNAMEYAAVAWRLLDSATEVEETDPQLAINRVGAMNKAMDILRRTSPTLYASLKDDRETADLLLRRTGMTAHSRGNLEVTRRACEVLADNGNETAAELIPKLDLLIAAKRKAAHRRTTYVATLDYVLSGVDELEHVPAEETLVTNYIERTQREQDVEEGIQAVIEAEGLAEEATTPRKREQALALCEQALAQITPNLEYDLEDSEIAEENVEAALDLVRDIATTTEATHEWGVAKQAWGILANRTADAAYRAVCLDKLDELDLEEQGEQAQAEILGRVGRVVSLADELAAKYETPGQAIDIDGIAGEHEGERQKALDIVEGGLRQVIAARKFAQRSRTAEDVSGVLQISRAALRRLDYGINNNVLVPGRLEEHRGKLVEALEDVAERAQEEQRWESARQVWEFIGGISEEYEPVSCEGLARLEQAERPYVQEQASEALQQRRVLRQGESIADNVKEVAEKLAQPVTRDYEALAEDMARLARQRPDVEEDPLEAALEDTVSGRIVPRQMLEPIGMSDPVAQRVVTDDGTRYEVYDINGCRIIYEDGIGKPVSELVIAGRSEVVETWELEPINVEAILEMYAKKLTPPEAAKMYAKQARTLLGKQDIEGAVTAYGNALVKHATPELHEELAEVHAWLTGDADAIELHRRVAEHLREYEAEQWEALDAVWGVVKSPDHHVVGAGTGERIGVHETEQRKPATRRPGLSERARIEVVDDPEGQDYAPAPGARKRPQLGITFDTEEREIPEQEPQSIAPGSREIPGARTYVTKPEDQEVMQTARVQRPDQPERATSMIGQGRAYEEEEATADTLEVETVTPAQAEAILADPADAYVPPVVYDPHADTGEFVAVTPELVRDLTTTDPEKVHLARLYEQVTRGTEEPAGAVAAPSRPESPAYGQADSLTVRVLYDAILRMQQPFEEEELPSAVAPKTTLEDEVSKENMFYTVKTSDETTLWVTDIRGQRLFYDVTDGCFLDPVEGELYVERAELLPAGDAQKIVLKYREQQLQADKKGPFDLPETFEEEPAAEPSATAAPEPEPEPEPIPEPAGPATEPEALRFIRYRLEDDTRLLTTPYGVLHEETLALVVDEVAGTMDTQAYTQAHRLTMNQPMYVEDKLKEELGRDVPATPDALETLLQDQEVDYSREPQVGKSLLGVQAEKPKVVGKLKETDEVDQAYLEDLIGDEITAEGAPDFADIVRARMFCYKVQVGGTAHEYTFMNGIVLKRELKGGDEGEQERVENASYVGTLKFGEYQAKTGKHDADIDSVFKVTEEGLAEDDIGVNRSTAEYGTNLIVDQNDQWYVVGRILERNEVTPKQAWRLLRDQYAGVEAEEERAPTPEPEPPAEPEAPEPAAPEPEPEPVAPEPEVAAAEPEPAPRADDGLGDHARKRLAAMDAKAEEEPKAPYETAPTPEPAAPSAPAAPAQPAREPAAAAAPAQTPAPEPVVPTAPAAEPDQPYVDDAPTPEDLQPMTPERAAAIVGGGPYEPDPRPYDYQPLVTIEEDGTVWSNDPTLQRQLDDMALELSPIPAEIGEVRYSPDNLLARAESYVEAGQPRQARETYQTLIDEHPGTYEVVDALVSLAELDELDGNDNQARDHLEEAHRQAGEIGRNDPHISYNLGRLYQRHDAPDVAQAYYLQATELANRRDDDAAQEVKALALNNLGVLAMDQGETGLGVNLFMRAQDNAPDDWGIARNLTLAQETLEGLADRTPTPAPSETLDTAPNGTVH